MARFRELSREDPTSVFPGGIFGEKGRVDFADRGRYHLAVATKIITLNAAEVELEKIRLIARVVSRGGVIVYPTETFYGLGANCFSREAVRRVFAIKKRSATRALPVIVADLEMAREIIRSVPPIFEELANLFWPAPLTFILKAAERLPEELVGSGRTIGVRMPPVSWLRRLVRETGSPLTATSANISGQREIASAEKAIQVFKRRVDLIVDGGKTPGRLPSTVLDLTSGKPRLLREGAFSSERLKKYL